MILNRVKKLIAQQLGVPESEITDETRLSEDLGADSLDMVELLMAFEDEFSTSISDELAINIKTVNDIVKMLETTKK